MQFESFSEFFNMGGYAFYVWLSYGVTFGSLGTLLFFSLRQKRSVLLEISKKMEREDRLKETRSSR
ncbi:MULTISPECIES: heme exporter protein CcmD [Shewanella]|uniref:heme exporter protein CcmD n=1 Tax=Shewanella TaxID=22 RepID=UPI001C7D4D0F|nr:MULTISPECIES: heme exporter protein CcmD [Shewanella]